MPAFEKNIKSVQKGYFVLVDGATQVEKKSTGLGGAFLNLGDSMLGLGATAAKVAAGGIAILAGGLAAVAKVSVDVAKDFESQIAIMSTAVDPTVVSMEDLSEAALMVGEDTSLVGVSATEAADAMTGLFKAGLDTTDVFGDINGYLEGSTELSGALRAAVDLQAASSLDLASASDAVAVAMNTFGLSAEDATRISDSFVQSADASVAEVEDLVDGLKNVGPTAAAFGFSLEDTNNALAILSTRGIQGSEAGTALKSMLTNIQRPTKAVKEEMAKLGVELFDSEGNMKDLRSIVIELSDALSEDAIVTERVGGASAKLTKAAEKARDKIPKLTTKIGEQETQLGILQQELAKTVEKYGDTSTQAQRKRLTIAKLTNDIAENKQEYNEYRKTIGQYESAASSATTATRKMTEEERNAAVQTIAGTYGMKALQTLIAEGADGWDVMAEATANASSASDVAFARTDTLDGALEALEGTIETLKIRIGSKFLPVLTDMARGFADFINDIAPKVEWVFESFTDWIGQVLPIAINYLASVWTDTLLPAIEDVWNFIEQNVIPIVKTIVDWIGEQLPKAIAFVVEHWDAFKGALIAIGAVLAGATIAASIAGIAGAIAALANPITAIIAVAGLLGAAWAEDWGGIRTFLTEVWENKLQPIFQEMWEWLQTNIPLAIQAASMYWEETLKPALETVWNFIVEKVVPALGDVWEWLQTAIPLAIQTASGFWENTLQPALSTVWEFITQSVLPAFGKVWTWLQEKIPEAISKFEQFWNEHLKGPLEDVWNFITVDLAEGFSSMITWLQEEIPNAIDSAKQAFDDIKNAIGQAWGMAQLFLGIIKGDLPLAIAELVGASDPMIETLGTMNILFEDIIPMMEAFAELWDALKELGMTLVTPLMLVLGLFIELKPATEDANEVLDDTTETISPLIGFFERLSAGIKGITSGVRVMTFFVQGLNRSIQAFLTESIAGWISAFEDLDKIIKIVKDGFGGLLDAIDSLKLPSWLTPGSPTPLEIGMSGIADVTRDTAGAIKQLGQALGDLLGIGAAGGTESVTESLEGLFSVASQLSSLGSGFAQMFEQKEIDPLNKSISELEDGLTAIAEERDALLESGKADIATTTRLNQLDAQEAQMTAQMNEQLKERAKLEERITQLQERQQQLAFLQQQFELLRMIQDFGLDPGEVLGDLELGVGADPGKLMDVMSNALASVLEQIDTLMTSGDPGQILEGLPEKTGEVWAFGDSMSGVLEATEGATKAFSGFMGALDDFSMPTELEPGSPSIFETILATIAELLSNILVKALDLFSAAFNTAAESWTEKLETVKAQIQDLYQNQFPLLQATVSSSSASIIDSLNSVIQTLVSLAEGSLPALADAFSTTFTDAQTLISDTEAEVGLLDASLTSMSDAGGTLETLKGAFDDTFGGADGATALIQDASSASDVLASSLSGLPGTLSGVKTAFQNAFTGANGATSVVNTAKNAVLDLITNLTGEGGLSDVVESVRSTWYDAWIEAAKSVITAVNAVNAALEQTISLLETVGELAGITGLALQEYLGGGAFAAPQTVQAPVTTNNITNVFQLGGNTINSGLDEAMLDARIRTIVASAIRTGK